MTAMLFADGLGGMIISISSVFRFIGIVVFFSITAVGCGGNSDSSGNISTDDPNSEKINEPSLVAILPVAEAGALQYSIVANTIQLDATASTGTELSYHWTLANIPDGSIAVLSDFEVAAPTFIADLAGIYIAQLIVSDNLLQTSKDFAVISVADTLNNAGNQNTVDHTGFIQSCQSCHNGVDAGGRPETHIAATEQCAACHSVDVWMPNVITDHNEILGTCGFCHNNSFAIGKPATHIPTEAECNECHIAGDSFATVLAIITNPAPDPTPVVIVDPVVSTVEHPDIGNLSCVDCHNGVISLGKGNNHIRSSALCAACHNTLYWEPAVTVEHKQIAGQCSSCHDNVIAQGKPANHIATNSECNLCHSSTTWVQPGSIGRAQTRLNIAAVISDIPATNDDVIIDDDHPSINDRKCVECHDNNYEEGKNPGHINTTDLCEACHNATKWDRIRIVDHNEVMGECSSCHNNRTAQGKPPGHIVTNAECNICHAFTGWTPATLSTGVASVDHSSFTQATECFSCHDGTTATGKSAGHIATTADCDVCHNISGWDPITSGTANVDHSGFTQATDCSACHDGTTAAGVSAGHVSITTDCDACHSTVAWLPVVNVSAVGTGTTDHSGFTLATDCSACHDGLLAAGKTDAHIVTQADCDVCHLSSAWLPAASSGGTVDHSRLGQFTVCSSCHNGRVATGKSATHIITRLDCDNCHNTTIWLSNTSSGSGPVDHSVFTADTICKSCHNGVGAIGKPSGHVLVVGDCDICHVVGTWLIN